MRKIGLLTFLSILVLLPAKLFAWGMTGHRIIAQIADDNVKKSTSKKIKDLLDDMPMAYWANWPDYIKSDKTGKWDHTHVWHYVNAPGNMSKTDFSNLLKGIEYDNLYKEILTLEKVLSNKESTKDEKKNSSYLLIHLVGDAHQPMHMGRPEDLGGNKIPVSWFGRKTNLHSLWDGQLIEYEKYSYTEYADLLNVLPKNAKKDIQKGELLDWLYDVHTIANEIYDSVNENDNLMYDYVYKYKTVVESQLQKGGLRLAAILDQVLK